MRLIQFPWESWIWLRATVVAGEESARRGTEHNGTLWQEVKSDRLTVVDQLKKYLGRFEGMEQEVCAITGISSNDSLLLLGEG
ncbi:hypothetical protein AVEN_109790-1 [Araneus ventricosus]|uniref:Uncharacterized protein n=1 Tax=Araneus ventricosus TaxID=182803 RepID=A0A4Y2MDA6_ARAVE|nr:hypothetical protein AVEN_109790-1 [Araneus ventricosus]